MGNLLSVALDLGWPVLVLLAGLLVYFQVSIPDPETKKRATFKIFIGMIAAVMLFIAIANYKINFFAESRLLPVSLAMITAMTLMMGLYFANLSALFKIGGMMFFVAAFLSGYGNWLPQVEGGFPPPEVKLDFNSMSPQQLADEGEKIIFGGVGQSKTQGAIGKGQCPLCHGFNQGFLSERAPNLWGLPGRLDERINDPRYHKGKPADRDTVEKEAFPGAGTAEVGQDYIAESHACPNCYVVAGFGVKGTNDKESPMPKIHKPPISLSIGEMAAVDTWMYVREGKEPPAYDEIAKSYEKFIPESDRPAQQEEKKDAGGGGGVLADGSEPVDQIFAKAQCIVCHTIPGIPGATGAVGPKLEEGTNAPLRIKSADYKGVAKTTREYIMESVINPGAYVVKPFADGVMPKIFGQKLTAGAINKIIDYLAQVQTGKEPPKIN